MHRSRNLFLVFLLTVCLLMSLTTSQAIAMQASIPFEATFAGSFQVSGDVGNSFLFIVQESGVGDEQTFGDFTYTASMFQNLARVPPNCHPSSSTGVGGFALLTFADGELALRRVSGTVCFAFPNISVDESWIIASGAGRYIGATGKLSRQLEGNVMTGIASGTINGTIKLAP